MGGRRLAARTQRLQVERWLLGAAATDGGCVGAGQVGAPQEGLGMDTGWLALMSVNNQGFKTARILSYI